MTTIGVALDGTTDLPPGKIAAIVTYLEMRQRPRVTQAANPTLALIRLSSADSERYLALFRLIGAPWLWYSRLLAGAGAAAALLADERIEAYAVQQSGEAIGLLELDFRRKGEAEIAFLGLVESATGRGLGQALMQAALVRAWTRPIDRLFVHTCTLDHPAALQFYQAAGFVAYKIAVEIAEDPRLSGLLEHTAGKHVPIVSGAAR
jgi:GNAT superfamily N-acetyltransferase